MTSINIINNSDGQLSVEADGKAILPSEIFTDVGIRPDTNFWDLRMLEEQYDLGFKNIMAGIEIYADANNADIDYSVEELPSSVEPEAGAMSTFHEGATPMNITKGRLRQIIQEELSRRIEAEVPEEELVVVTADELEEARQAAYNLIKRSLESGADAVSLLGTVQTVYDGSVPSHILELFSNEE